jgi:hypothetical protein
MISQGKNRKGKLSRIAQPAIRQMLAWQVFAFFPLSEQAVQPHSGF